MLFDNMDQYVIHDIVSVLHVSNFLIGMICALLIKWSGSNRGEKKIDSIDWRIMIYAPAMLLVAISWHLSVYVVSVFYHFVAPVFKDSFNFVLGAGSIIMPYLGARKRIAALEIVRDNALISKLILAIYHVVHFCILILLEINFFRFGGLYFRLTFIQLLFSAGLFTLVGACFTKYFTALSKLFKKKPVVAP